ncbi:baculoviral IAP repeat-containing protein 3-like [Penaeus chinensis]|uniref:baculoviral IAP repeat-containing protein 3-like n=1 Tax=Penaeus chinensis TaxID=139456 RepID=UPI001FB7A955|nr:baculoviral IAP repeat-containing protein 3-like [Penaeus chinensis]XP_047499234.1 baculoviral IAP repeat-containing protein 3-like [Penaeus chinensis]
MEKEQDRHDTFRSIQDIIHATHHPRVFARAGFYKYDQSVICFKCNLKIDISEINKVNDIVEYHTTKNPECIFARNLPPLPRSKVIEQFNTDLRYEVKRLETFIDWPDTLTEPKDLAAAGFFYRRKGNDCICYYCGICVTISPTQQLGSQYPIMTMHGQSNPNCKFAQGEAVGNVPISIASIAEAGFFYKGYRDHVYCFHCNLGICNWERNDNPWILHAMYNPDCPYIRKLGYAAIEQAKREKRLMYKKPAPHSPVTENDWDILMGLDITKKLQISEYPTCAIKDCLKDQIMKYRKPFCTIQECIMAIRLKITSYGKMDTGLWDRIIDYAKDKNYLLPNIKHDINEDNEAQDDKAEHIQFSDDTSVTIRDIHLKKNPDCRFAQGKPSPELLVEAGFYHIGISDHVQCFHCGVGLRNWEWDDDPWELHAKWNPDCIYVKLINKVRVEESYIPLKGTLNISQDQHDRLEITKQDWNNLLGLDYTRNLIIQGFPVIAVRDALRDQILQTGIPFSSEVECVSAVRTKIESYKNIDRNDNDDIANLKPECLVNYQTVYAVMRFTQMITKKKYESSYPIDNTEDPIYLFKQSTFISNIDPNIPEYGHEIFFKLPYPDHRYNYHLENTLNDLGENVLDELVDKHDHTDEKRLCKVCMTDEVDVVILPCDHMVCCAKCLLTQSKCPICRGTIEKVVKPILL